MLINDRHKTQKTWKYRNISWDWGIKEDLMEEGILEIIQMIDNSL